MPAKKENNSKKKIVKKINKPTKVTGPVEKKLEDILEKNINKSSTESFQPLPAAKGNSVIWMVLSAILLLAFAAILVYQFVPGLKKNIDSLIPNISKIIPQKTADQQVKAPEVEQAPFVMNLTAIYNTTDKFQVDAVQGYKKGISEALKNTTVEIKEQDYNLPESKELLAKIGSISVPVFVVDSNIVNHPQYSDFASSIGVKDEVYFLKTDDGMEYFKLPDANQGVRLGAELNKAQVVAVEYTSFSCPYCKKYQEVVEQVLAKFGTEVSWVVKHYDRGGPDVVLASAALCADEQGKYEVMAELLYAKQDEMIKAAQEPAKLDEFVRNVGKEAKLNAAKLDTCLKNNTYKERIANETKEAVELGIRGTPGIFINNRFFPGAIPAEITEQVINEELNKKK